ncbi:MAG TPA: RagB/SusD family nutrient uptake outer membrane protein [Balneolaceae bacterium]|nr:RagB/SusD family nutrient uptake outer membrane protein [Balneolaceae bacterium]
MMRKKKIYLLLFVVSLVFHTSCDDFLTQSDPSSFTRDNYFVSPEHAESAVKSIYADLRSVRGGGFGGATWSMLEFATGLAGTELGQATSSLIIRDLENDSDNAYGSTYWWSHYRGIANANLAIENIPDIQMNEDQKNQLLGEARFLRAYYYYFLVRIFGDVPLILEPIDLTSEQLEPQRSSVAEVYNVIVEDLIWAETQSGLPYYGTDGRVTLGAVQSLLASVYLTMAGYPLELGVEYYRLSRDKAAEVINSNSYWLFDNYADLKNEETENTGEHIFMTQFDASIANHDGLQVFIIPYNQGISVYSSETGGIFARREFVESYEEGDLRAEEKQFYFREFTRASDRDTPYDMGSYYLYKWFDDEAHLTTGVSGMNWPLLRYAEVLLIFAEAENEVENGPTPEAYQAVNLIRERAELPALSQLDQNSFREAVWKEKWHELSYENKTWFDMVRLRKGFNSNTGEFEDFVGHQFVYGPVLTERELLFPIPTSEIRNNKNLTQNPGY